MAHGGSLVLSSEIGRGTTVTMTLPALRRDLGAVKEEL
jgi:signal transduction histidine kinase